MTSIWNNHWTLWKARAPHEGMLRRWSSNHSFIRHTIHKCRTVHKYNPRQHGARSRDIAGTNLVCDTLASCIVWRLVLGYIDADFARRYYYVMPRWVQTKREATTRNLSISATLNCRMCHANSKLHGTVLDAANKALWFCSWFLDLLEPCSKL